MHLRFAASSIGSPRGTEASDWSSEDLVAQGHCNLVSPIRRYGDWKCRDKFEEAEAHAIGRTKRFRVPKLIPHEVQVALTEVQAVKASSELKTGLNIRIKAQCCFFTV